MTVMSRRQLLSLMALLIIAKSNASALTRSDYLSEHMTSNEMERGSWSDKIYCNEGQYAMGYALKVEPYKGSIFIPAQDDTAANGFKLICTNSETIQANNDGPEGTYETTSCPNNALIISYKTRIEGNCNCGDDTTLNDVYAKCDDIDSTEITTTNGLTFGGWSNYVQCPEYSAVCGFRQRVEGTAPADDTALSAVRLQCCKVPTMTPSRSPTMLPTVSPSRFPTMLPTMPPSTPNPSGSPSKSPSNSPTVSPSTNPSSSPIISPSNAPTISPSNAPTLTTSFPTVIPTLIPTYYPSTVPTSDPTVIPTVHPTSIPTSNPSLPEKEHDEYDPSTTETSVKNDIKQKEKGGDSITIILSVIGVCIVILICILIYFGRYAWRKSKSMEKNQQQHMQLTGSISKAVSISNPRSVSNALFISHIAEEKTSQIDDNNSHISMAMKTKGGGLNEAIDDIDNVDNDDDIKITDDGNGDTETMESSSGINDITTPTEPKNVAVGVSDDEFIVYGDDEIIGKEGDLKKATLGSDSSDDEIVRAIDTVQ